MLKRTRNILLVSLCAIFLGGVALGVILEMSHWFVCNFTSVDGEEHAYYIYPETSTDSLIALLETDYHIASKGSLRRYAEYAGMQAPRPGYYRFGTHISNRTLVIHLQYGHQTPIRLSFTNVLRTPQQLAARLDKVLLLDSAEVMARLDSADYMAQFGLNRATAICLFIPNTYEVYWTISADDLFARMNKEYKRFWTDDRLQQAQALGLTPTQVATLASIVESETHNTQEHPLIASLYLNRLRKGMALQACPTVIYANGDFSVRRVLTAMLQKDSPYNTYKYTGLPPGPIRCTNGAAIDAVLHAPKTDYLYMCANPDWSGTHVFSSTYAQHQRVAAAYHRELNGGGMLQSSRRRPNTQIKNSRK